MPCARNLIASGLSVLALGVSGFAVADVVVVSIHANSASIDEEQIAKIFLDKPRPSNGSEAIPIDQKEGPVREDFGNKFPKKNPSQLKAQWARRLTGGAKPPKELASDDEILKFVASTPGAIATWIRARSTKL